ncbi:sugar (and other) transporter family protein [Mycobacterium kansasii 732]|uniref:MFS transporter n=1 Tax=Mycobacterium pseudokansasii TaxID=2341080 RepID=UPI0004514F86|nr:MFS transporter [Mycobacterium pseudokansasii]EUA14200.1 sugar (and other) transporter family protein [Mycobacterium kansasii 732]
MSTRSADGHGLLRGTPGHVGRGDVSRRGVAADTDANSFALTLALLTSTAFLLFAQIFMVAPILPALARDFGSTEGMVGLGVPAFLVPYGWTVLVWGTVSDRWGRRRVILMSLCAFVVLTAATPLATNVGEFIALRFVTGVAAGGVVPISVALIGDLVPYRRRGRVLGWVFGGAAGGMAFGAAGGALGEPLVGWHGLFGVVAVGGLVLLVLGLWSVPDTVAAARPSSVRQVAAGFAELLSTSRGRRTYGYVLVNAVLHAGVYTWLGVYLHDHVQLDEEQIGLVLLGYGIPGLVLSPAIGRLADRYGRARVIPLGLALTAACAAVFASEPSSLVLLQAAVVSLSLGYDMTQPALVVIVTDLPGQRGQAIGLNSCVLWVGMGIGSLVFQAILLPLGFSGAFAWFAGLSLLAGAVAIPLFRAERPPGGSRVSPAVSV